MRTEVSVKNYIHLQNNTWILDPDRRHYYLQDIHFWKWDWSVGKLSFTFTFEFLLSFTFFLRIRDNIICEVSSFERETRRFAGSLSLSRFAFTVLFFTFTFSFPNTIQYYLRNIRFWKRDESVGKLSRQRDFSHGRFLPHNLGGWTLMIYFCVKYSVCLEDSDKKTCLYNMSFSLTRSMATLRPAFLGAFPPPPGK